MSSRILVCLLLISCTAALVAQQAAAPLLKGVINDRVVCRDAPDQSYALYVPSNYTPAKKWAMLYAFDPEARGGLPVKLFKDAAEKYGYIVVGSWNSQNGPVRPQVDALRAMWSDTHQRFAIDNQRIYMTGFSGGARMAVNATRI